MASIMASGMSGAGPAQERPRFRHDLVAEVIEEQGARFIDVADPDSGNMFRFYEVEYSLACAMDGERDVAGIVKWAQEELGLTPSAKEIRTVISTLGDLGFIDLGGAAAAASPVPAAVARSRPEDELAPGIVVGARAPAEPSSYGHGQGQDGNDVELGHAGGISSAPVRDLPKAPDLDLGAPGTTATPRVPQPPVEDIPLGASGRQSDVSLDLADHIAVRPDDVKEAVRASKVMTSVDVPKELLAASEPVLAKPTEPAAKSSGKAAADTSQKAKSGDKAAAKASEKASEKAADKAATAKASSKAADAAAAKASDASDKAKDKAATAKASSKAADAAAAKAAGAAGKPADKGGKPPVELPKQAVAPSKDAAKGKLPTAPEDKAGVSGLLIAALILAVLGVGAFAYWKYVLDKPDAPATTPPDHSAELGSAPAAPPPPPPPTAKIALETPPGDEIKSVVAGQIESIENDKDVKAGDVVARLVGHKALETALAALAVDEKRVQGEVDAALAARDGAGANAAAKTAAETKLADRQKSLAAKRASRDAKRADLEKLIMKAPSDGKVTSVAKAGQAVKVDDMIAKIARPPVPVATFKVANPKVAVNTAIPVTANGKTFTCTVTAVTADSVKVTCPDDAGLADATEVTVPVPN